MSAWQTLIDEFCVQKLTLSFPHQATFYSSQWRGPYWFFLVYRLILACYSNSGLIHYFIVWSNPDQPAIVFLTTWSYIVLTLHFQVAFVTALWQKASIYQKKNEADSDSDSLDGPDDGYGSIDTSSDSTKSLNKSLDTNSDNTSSDDDSEYRPSSYSLPWYLKLSWILANTAYITAITVTLLFYSFVFNKLKFRADDVNAHIMNTVVVVIDVTIAAIPIRFLHVIYPILFGIVYGIFNIVYWSYDRETNVLYIKLIDWGFPQTAVPAALIILFILFPFLQLLFFTIYRAKLYLYYKLYGLEYLEYHM